MVQFPTPQNVEDVRRLLGVATYISKFIPCFSRKTSVLRRLLKADAAFEWTVEHERALRAMQEELQSEKFLVIFDPFLPTQIATDAGRTSLGAVLLQNGRPVSYAARSLTKAEQNYWIIEKELLAAVFALRRFHYYTLGRRIEILTDHQPLLGAARNALLRNNPHVDWLFDQILAYNIKWTYVPGKTNYRMQLTPLSLRWRVDVSFGQLLQHQSRRTWSHLFASLSVRDGRNREPSIRRKCGFCVSSRTRFESVKG